MDLDILATQIVYKLDEFAREYNNEYGLPVMSHDEEMKKLVMNLISKQLNIKQNDN